MSDLVNLSAQITFDHASLSTAKADHKEAEQTLRAVQFLNRTEFSSSNQSNTGLSFSYDADSQRATITVVDRSTGETLYQMPSREVLRLAADVRRKQKTTTEAHQNEAQYTLEG